MDTNTTSHSHARNVRSIANASGIPLSRLSVSKDASAKGTRLSFTRKGILNSESVVTTKGDIEAGKRNLVLGIDPGLSGALAFYCAERAQLIDVKDMPLTTSLRGKRVLNLYGLAKLIKDVAPLLRLVVIEAVHSMPYQSSVSTFTFGEVFGQTQGIIASNMLKMIFVRPEVWKAQLGLSSDKNLSRQKAIDLFPTKSELFSRAKYDGRAESALIAYFAAKFLFT